MPWSDPNSWLMGFLGFPFMLREGEGQPKMNKPRAIEGLVITIVGALLTSTAGYLWLVPELQKDAALLKQAQTTHAEQLEEHVRKSYYLRREDRRLNKATYERIESALGDIKDKVNVRFLKYDNDLYAPKNGQQ